MWYNTPSGGTKIYRNGKDGDKRCPGKSFILEYTYNGWKPSVNEQIISMAPTHPASATLHAC